MKMSALAVVGLGLLLAIAGCGKDDAPPKAGPGAGSTASDPVTDQVLSKCRPLDFSTLQGYPVLNQEQFVAQTKPGHVWRTVQTKAWTLSRSADSQSGGAIGISVGRFLGKDKSLPEAAIDCEASTVGLKHKGDMQFPLAQDPLRGKYINVKVSHQSTEEKRSRLRLFSDYRWEEVVRSNTATGGGTNYYQLPDRRVAHTIEFEVKKPESYLRMMVMQTYEQTKEREGDSERE